MMHGPEKSDPAIVAGKPTKKVERSAAELVERRAGAEGNAGQQSTRWTQCRLSVSQVMARIRQTTAVDTRGGSRMRESRTYGSERGARGNSRPYRESGGSSSRFLAAPQPGRSRRARSSPTASEGLAC